MDTPDSALADPQQIIADLQRQLAEAEAERDESEAQKAAIADLLGIINSNPGNLQPVFDAMLEKALRQCSADCGVLFTYDGDVLHAAAHRGLPAVAEYVTRGPLSVGVNNAHGRLLRGEQVVHIPDLTDDEAYRSGDPMRRALVDAGGRSLLAVPLRKEGVFLGDVVIYRKGNDVLVTD